MFRALMQHKMIVIGVGIIAAAALWFGLSQSSGPAPTIVTTSPDGTTNVVGGTPVAGPVDKDTQQILEVLLALRSVKLDDAIFTNAAFVSLKDFSTQIVPEPVGRPDPFAPIGNDATSTGASAGATPVSFTPPAGSGSTQRQQLLQLIQHQQKNPAGGK